MAGDLLAYRGLRAAWSFRRRYFQQGFRELVDAKIASIPSNAPLPYEPATVPSE